MSVPLHDLGGPYDSIAEVERVYRHQGREWAFGWCNIRFARQAEPTLCFIGWLPPADGKTDPGMCCLPVYRVEADKPDIAGHGAWHWDGCLHTPTLVDSVKRTIQLKRDGEVREVYHGFVRKGAWTPC